MPGGLHLTVHILCLAVLALFAFGVCTPLTSILAYLITVSYAYRAPLANYGLDQINAIAALYLVIGPSGAALSIDRLWRRKRNAKIALAAGKTPVEVPVVPSARANLALRLIQVHVCVIYIFACQSKLQGESWWNGQAIWQAVSNLEYQSTDLTWLAWYPWLVNILTHGTVLFEMTFWALVWRPLCRPIVLLIGVAIHLGIGAFMGMWTFGLAMIFLYVAFVPATTIHAVLQTFSRLVGRRVGQDESPSELAPPELEWADEERPVAATVANSLLEPVVAAPSIKRRDDAIPQLPRGAAPALRIDSASHQSGTPSGIGRRGKPAQAANANSGISRPPRISLFRRVRLAPGTLAALRRRYRRDRGHIDLVFGRGHRRVPRGSHCGRPLVAGQPVLHDGRPPFGRRDNDRKRPVTAWCAPFSACASCA